MALACVSFLPQSSLGQVPLTVSGRVLNQTIPDSAPAAGVRVVMHEVSPSVQGPVDSTATDRSGMFRFRFSADSESVYLLSARHHGIEYFSAPLRGEGAVMLDTVLLVVSDTSSAVLVQAPNRHIVIAPPTSDGIREIVDFITLQAAGGRLTRVSPDSLTPNWAGPLPLNVRDARVGESDFSPDAVRIERDSVFLFAPIAPGEKQLLVQYWIPVDQASLTIPSASDEVDLYIEGDGATADGPQLVAVAPEEIGGSQFARWSGTPPQGTSIDVRLSPPGRKTILPIIVLVGMMSLTLAVASVWLIRRPREARASADADQFIESLAQLDARYHGRQGEVAADEWKRYQRERAELKRLVVRALAQEGRPR
jgi:hypothetical protein